jgi:hypothetical protein
LISGHFVIHINNALTRLLSLGRVMVAVDAT